MSINPRILVAAVIGLVLVGLAFFYASEKKLEADQSLVVKMSDGVKLREYIEVEDSNGDTVPDWQEVFANGEVNLDATSTKTKTSELAARIGSLVVQSGRLDSPFTAEQVVDTLARGLELETLENQTKMSDLKILNSDAVSDWKKYGNAVASIAIKNSVESGVENELIILDRALKNAEPTELEKLDSIIFSYTSMVADMLANEVPSSLANEHLALINSYRLLESDIEDFRNVHTDAASALISFRRYPKDAETLYTAISNLYLKLHNAGIQWNASDDASRFIRIETP